MKFENITESDKIVRKLDFNINTFGDNEHKGK